MNKNTKARRAQALKNFHSKSSPQSETAFQVPQGGGAVVTWRVPIGFVKPKEPKRKSAPIVPRHEDEDGGGEVTVVTTTRSGKQVTVPAKK